MKLLASALALVLIGVAGVWLWFDAAADAQRSQGVVVAGAFEPAPGALDAAGDRSTEVVTGVGAAMLVAAAQSGTAALTSAFDDAVAAAEKAAKAARAEAKAEKEEEAARAAEEAAAQAAEEAAEAQERAAREAERAAAEAAEQAAREAEEAARQAAPPAQPAPVNPPGMCWDDDEWEECDDDGDDD